MPLFFLKSLLSIPVVLCALIAMFTMFEVFGRAERRFDQGKLKRIHRANGMVYLLLFALISYLCLSYLSAADAEPPARAVFHSVFALSVLVLLLLKLVMARFYRQYYGHVKVLGLLVALLTFGMAGTSGGYYLLVRGLAPVEPSRAEEAKKEPLVALRTDVESISRGRELYGSKCSGCHDPSSSETIIGPGHKGILKNPGLPVSGRPATPASIARQLRSPYRDMPSFDYLGRDEVEALIAYMNTL
jgi:mono/diheme cytochrome c family protein